MNTEIMNIKINDIHNEHIFGYVINNKAITVVAKIGEKIIPVMHHGSFNDSEWLPMSELGAFERRAIKNNLYKVGECNLTMVEAVAAAELARELS